MTGPGPDKRKSVMVLESNSGPVNHRDASGTEYRWRNPPTPIRIPAAGERLQRPRPHDNPYSRLTNTLGSQRRPPGNPNVLQTVLAKPPDGRSFDIDSRSRKRQKFDTGISSSITLNGASSPYARGPSRSNIFGPDIQVIESPPVVVKRGNPAPNDADIIDLRASSDDLGERVPRAAKSSSPDPLLLTQETVHPFEMRPTEYSSSASNKGKNRAKELLELVEGSEEEDDISEFTPPPSMGRSSNANTTQEIPSNIVHDRKRLFERPPASARVIEHPIQKGVNSIDLTTGSVIRKMKKKGEGVLRPQRNIAVFDRVGTSSSNFSNSSREREKIRTLPLDAWCLGQHLFQYPESAPLELSYEVASLQIRVTWGRSPPEKIEFKLDRDVDSAIIVNDEVEPLKRDVVVQFSTTSGSTWKGAEGKYKGFKGGGGRGRETMTFHLSTEKDRGFTATGYQTFVSMSRKAFKKPDVQVISPAKGAIIWNFASQCAAMFERKESRGNQEDHSENVPDNPPIVTRFVTSPSISVKTDPGLPPEGESGPSMPQRRSTRQSAIRSMRASSLSLQPAQLEPDEVVLMYPPTGTGALSIMHSDLKRLQPEEYLNDTLIEFGLKLWLNDLREKDPALADQIHVFSSFFYKKLNNRKNPEDGYKSVRKWTSKIDIFTKKYIIVPINENIHWYLAIIYEPGHTLEPPLPLSQASNSRTTRSRKQNRQPANSHPETLTKVSLERLSPTAHITKVAPEVDISSMDATRATTPSTTENDEIDDVAITVFDKSCSITAGSVPVSVASSEIQMRDSSPNLVHPPSDSMDVDANTSVTDVPNPICEVAEVWERSTSKSSSGISVNQFYGSMPKPGDVGPLVIDDNEDSGEDRQQEAEVDDMLAVTQSLTGDLPSQTYIFTLDSLGTRHPQAIRVLKQYLEWEAKDKRNFDEVRFAAGKQVQVPVQPNTWDCGIYLLHFVKVFVNAPSEFVEQILSTRSTMPSPERKKMWQDHELPQFRGYLKSRIIELSEEWKAEKTVRGGETDKRRDGDALEIEVVSSEGEVDIVEDISSVKATPSSKQKRPATRLRG